MSLPELQALSSTTGLTISFTMVRAREGLEEESGAVGKEGRLKKSHALVISSGGLGEQCLENLEAGASFPHNIQCWSFLRFILVK